MNESGLSRSKINELELEVVPKNDEKKEVFIKRFMKDEGILRMYKSRNERFEFAKIVWDEVRREG